MLRLALYDQFHAIRKCEAKCQYAKNPKCTCICGGALHGKGYILEREYQYKPIRVLELELQAKEALAKHAKKLFKKTYKIQERDGQVFIKGSAPEQLSFLEGE